ncbi:high light inducible protein isoform 1 [Galdieria sulphuraria]|nr:high light inducible protein isoform 1 [Galdieria sulphuraria]EME32199.1 high light inducible protein isoform 1 [Galdieria sulphuraria]|eukprot:XP_005708719.1 high light inducible protein isoform 1 [Galdieria sulphuraria]
MGYIVSLQPLYKQNNCRLQNCSLFSRKKVMCPRSSVRSDRVHKPMPRFSMETGSDFVQPPKQVRETENERNGEAAEHLETNLEQNQPIDFSFTPEELREQARKLDELAEVWREERLQQEREANRKFGFTPFAETLNGRLAMSFLLIGLLTEYWTGFTIVDQIAYILEILGFT